MLSISVRSLDYYLAAGYFDTRRNGRRVLITRASLVRFSQSNHFGPVRESTAKRNAESSK